MLANQKPLLSIVFLFAFAVLTNGQSAFLDAQKLSHYFTFNEDLNILELKPTSDFDRERIVATLRNYCPDAFVQQVEDMLVVNLEGCFEENPFILADDNFQGLSSMSISSSVIAPRPEMENQVPDRGGSGGGSLMTNIADGLARFVVKRTKEELNAAFFNKLREAMADQVEFQVLFPTTYELSVNAIGEQIFHYNAYIEALREGFLRDMKALPLNTRSYVSDSDLLKKEESRLLVEDFLHLTQYLVDGEPPMRMLEFLAKEAALQDTSRRSGISDPVIRAEFQDMAAGLKALDLFAASLRSDKIGLTWVRPEELSRELQNIRFAYLYLGLLFQQGQGIEFSGGRSLQAELRELAGYPEVPLSAKNYLKTLASTASQLDKSFRELVDGERDSISYDDYYRVADLTFDLLELVGDMRNKIIVPEWVKDLNGKPVLKPIEGPKLPSRSSVEKRGLGILRQMYELELNIRQNHYTSAVNNLVLLLTDVLAQDSFKFKKDILLYGNFMATVAEAQTSQEVADAIELFALPPGSSRMKKYSDLSVSLNTYGGFAVGLEQDLDVNYAGKTVFSPSAPIGVGLNFGLYEKGSLSLYSQLIDIGAVFAYRFSNETENIPEIKFQNILAPGFYAIYGFGGNLPLSLGVGAQLGPNLRKVTAATLTADKTRAWRLGLMLSVDIPVTHFYTK